jgi:hypothetical protein
MPLSATTSDHAGSAAGHRRDAPPETPPSPEPRPTGPLTGGTAASADTAAHFPQPDRPAPVDAPQVVRQRHCGLPAWALLHEPQVVARDRLSGGPVEGRELWVRALALLLIGCVLSVVVADVFVLDVIAFVA